MISYVVAVSKNGVIGREGGLPWHISSDLKRFKEITMGKPVVMGRITRQRDFAPEGAEVVATAEQALRLCGDAPEVAVIGGGEIYRLFWPLVDRLYLTEVDLDVDGDTHFPEVRPEDWREVGRELHARGERDSASFTLRILDRMTKS